MIAPKKLFALAAATALLSACGGGGGSSQPPAAQPASLNDADVQVAISAAVSALDKPFRWEVVPVANTVFITGDQAGLRINVARYSEETLESGAQITERGESLGSAITDGSGKVDLGVLGLPASSTEMVLVELFDDQRPQLGALASSKVRADRIAGLQLNV